MTPLFSLLLLVKKLPESLGIKLIQYHSAAIISGPSILVLKTRSSMSRLNMKPSMQLQILRISCRPHLVKMVNCSTNISIPICSALSQVRSMTHQLSQSISLMGWLGELSTNSRNRTWVLAISTLLHLCSVNNTLPSVSWGKILWVESHNKS